MSRPERHQPYLPSQPYVPPQAYWQPSPPAPRQNNGLVIAAIVIGSLALLAVLGLLVSQLVFGLVFGGLMSLTGGFSPPDSGLKGTAPQVVAGQTYPGARLADEVSRVAGDQGGDVGTIACPETSEVVAGAVSECHGAMDGSNWDFRVTFEDASGHFTLDEKVH